MFLSRKGVWFPLSVLLIYSFIGSVWSTEQDDDTIGNAFGSLFKAILNVVKSQFEATKDFVPGLDKAGGGTSTNDTAQNAGVNGTKDEETVDLTVGMESKNIFINDESFVLGSTASPSTDGKEDVSSPSGIADHGTFDEKSHDSMVNRPGQEHQGQSVSDQVTEHETGDKVANQADTIVQRTHDENQSTNDGEAPGNSEIPVVPFSSEKSLSPEERLPGMGEVQATDAWPFQPDVQEMLGVLEEEITQPLDGFQSSSNNGDQELDKAGFVHADNMTDTDTYDTVQSTKYSSQEAEMLKYEGTELGRSEILNNGDNTNTNATGTAGSNLDGNLSSSEGLSYHEAGGFNGGKSLSGAQVWPFGGVMQTVEKELISLPGKFSQGHDDLGGGETNGVAADETFKEFNPITDNAQAQTNDITFEKSNIKDEDVSVQTDNNKTDVSIKESAVDQKQFQSPGETEDTKGSDEADTLLRLVNTL